MVDCKCYRSVDYDLYIWCVYFFIGSRFTVFGISILFLLYCILRLVDFYVFYNDVEKEEQKTIVQQLKDMRWSVCGSLIFYIMYTLYILYNRKNKNKKLDDAFKTIIESVENVRKKNKKCKLYNVYFFL